MTYFARCTAILLLAAGAAGAKTGTPGPQYFAGMYDTAGRSAGAQPGQMSGPAQIIPQGDTVVIRSCDAPDVVLSFGPAFEIVNLMTGAQAGDATQCLFHNNGYNRPILTCRSAGGAAFTLWPLAHSAPPLPC